MKNASIRGSISLVLALALSALVPRVQAEDQQLGLHIFSKRTGGYAPVGVMLEDSAGNLYGAAYAAGIDDQCCGVIFELSPATGGGYTYTEIYVFSGSTTGDSNPLGSLVMDAAGNLYGAAGGIDVGAGEIFELSPSGSGSWVETILYTQPSNGFGLSPVVIDPAGNLYGAASYVGTNDDGNIFELSPSSRGWTFTDILDFNGTNGNQPNSVTLDAAGNLYGTTYYGGTSTNCTDGCGVVFELSNKSGSWAETVIHEFNGTNGSGPQAPVTIDASGNLFTSATAGGQFGFGAIFELTPAAGGWQAHPLHDFKGHPTDGAFPNHQMTIFGGTEPPIAVANRAIAVLKALPALLIRAAERPSNSRLRATHGKRHR
jgi:uncharacterized repeat protein (TIGR03803 family)